MEKQKTFHAWIYSILGALFILALVWGFGNKKNVSAMQNQLNNNYNRAFSELTDYIDNIDTQLTKAQLAATPSQLASVANDIFSESAQAKSCLGQLPTSTAELENTAKFLSQVGDYTYVLSQKMINGEEISAEEYSTLASLNEYASTLKEALIKLQENIFNGSVSFFDKNNSFNSVNADETNILESMQNVEKSFDEYPSLIYDGPFSEHIQNITPKMTSDKPEISQEEAQNIALNFLEQRTDTLDYSGESQNTPIPCYIFSASLPNEQITVSVTKQGGYILYFLDNTIVSEENLSIDEATAKALEFLEKNGFSDMTPSYYEKENNIATLNFAYTQNGVTCYSDLVKVSVALDSGKIVGFESNGYITNHTEREIDTPVLSEEEAKSRVSTSLDVSLAKLALIPKDSLKEILCYEFKGTFNGKNFIVYVNALNGREEKILLLIESENGILTI